MTKLEAIEFAKKYSWTVADAKRAFADLDLNTANKEDLLMALANFAGKELLNRQRLQAAQKAQVTRKKNEIKQIEIDYQQQMEKSKHTIEEMQSLFIPVIAKLYRFSQQFGLQDPWIEAMLETYEQHERKAS
ncbi:MAG: hypothetical protein AB4063_07410 [Crocosphaera sp.]